MSTHLFLDRHEVQINVGATLRTRGAFDPSGQMREVVGEVIALYTAPPGATIRLSSDTTLTFKGVVQLHKAGQSVYVSLPGVCRTGVNGSHEFVCRQTVPDRGWGTEAFAEVVSAQAPA